MKYICLICALLCPSIFPQSATEIIKTGEETMRGKSIQALMTMTIIRPSFRRTLELRTWARGTNQTLVEILQPTKEEGVSSLRVKYHMWNYLPKVDQVVRVPSSLMLQSWMGSDFTNDDLMKSSSLQRDYRHKKLRITKLRGRKTVLIRCLPKPQAPVVWGKILHWARLRDSLPLKQQYYDEAGALVRTIHFSRFKQMDDRIIPTKITVTTSDGHSTIVQYKKILFDRRVSRQIFSKERLARISQRGLNLSSGWVFSRLPSYRKQKKARSRKKFLARRTKRLR